MKLKKLEVLSKEEIETITSSALRILETIGIKIDDDKTRKICEEKGAIFDGLSSFCHDWDSS